MQKGRYAHALYACDQTGSQTSLGVSRAQWGWQNLYRAATGQPPGGPSAGIDIERGSASKYTDLFTLEVTELDSFQRDRRASEDHARMNA
jgi:hypothetical protein